MNTKSTIAVLLAAFSLAWASPAAAADNGTEFGVEDDLTVLGTGGSAIDPDLEIKGFAVFGATQAAPSLNIPVAAGNIFANGYVQVSSGMYVAGSSTFTQRVEIQGYGVLKSTVQFTGNTGALTNVYFDNAAANAGKVLKAGSDGFLTWQADNNTVMTFQTPYRIQMVNGTDTDLADSLFLQEAAGGGITLVNASSFTVTGALEAYGAAKFNGAVTLGDAAGDAVTINGNASALGTLSVNGDVDLNAKLNVDGASTFVSSMTAKGDTQLGDAVTDIHGVNMAPAADTALSVAGQSVSGDYAAKFYSGAALAAWIKKK